MKLRFRKLSRGACFLRRFPSPASARADILSSRNAAVRKCGAPQAATFPPAPAAETTGGFDGARAYKHVEQLVAIGPHSAGSEGIRRAQEYIVSQLKSFGCPVEEAGFSCAVNACGRRGHEEYSCQNSVRESQYYFVWIALRHEADGQFCRAPTMAVPARESCWSWRGCCAREKMPRPSGWHFLMARKIQSELDRLTIPYGSRELAASLAHSGDLPHVKAMILVDMVGPTIPCISANINSTPWLIDILWSTAARLGYGKIFVNDLADIEDDHLSFLKRDIPSADIIDLDVPYWHTTHGYAGQSRSPDAGDYWARFDRVAA